MFNTLIHPLSIATVIALSIAASACGRRPSNYGLTDAASSSAVLKQGQTLCSKSSCPRLDLSLDVEVANQSGYIPGSTIIQVPAGSSTQMRFTARTTGKSITRKAAILLKDAAPFIQQGPVSAGSITVAAAPQAGASGTIEIQVRDLTYCEATAKNPQDCVKASVANDADKFYKYTVTAAPPQGQGGQGAFVLPSQARCVQPPSDLEQTVGTLQQAIGIGTSLLRGNFIPVITNIAGGLTRGAEADRQGTRQGC